MNIDIIQARNGSQTYKIDGTLIHSAYNPEKEAQRFINNKIGDSKPGTIILLGAGGGYILNEIKRHYPDRKTIAIWYDTGIYHITKPEVCCAWHPECDTEIRPFLFEHISELDIEGMVILQWQPCVKIFGSLHNTIMQSLSNVIQQLNGSLMTVKTFGKRWINNAVSNLLHFSTFYKSLKIQDNICITASGPSLEYCVPFLKEWMKSMQIFALPSSLAFLSKHGIMPDAVITTDPGFYSSMHFQWNNREVPLFMPITAYKGISKQNWLPVLIYQKSFIESLLLSQFQDQLISIPENGTVAGTALEIALKLTNQNIFLCGQDFGYQDIFCHVRPHMFDRLFQSTSTRFETELGIRSKRAFTSAETRVNTVERTSLPLKTYAQWFQAKAGEYKGRVFRLFPSSVLQNDIPSVSIKDAVNIVQGADKKQKICLEKVQLCADPEKFISRHLESVMHILKNAEKDLSNTPVKAVLFSNQRIFTVLYQLYAGELIRIRKLSRTGELSLAKKEAESILSKAHSFIHAVKKRTTGYQGINL